MPAVFSKHACRGRDDDNGASAGRSQTSGDGSGREQQNCAWQAQELSSDGGGWKALKLHTGAVLKPDAELVHQGSGARRPLYLFWEAVAAIEESPTATKHPKKWENDWFQSAAKNFTVWHLRSDKATNPRKLVGLKGIAEVIAKLDAGQQTRFWDEYGYVDADQRVSFLLLSFLQPRISLILGHCQHGATSVDTQCPPNLADAGLEARILPAIVAALANALLPQGTHNLAGRCMRHQHLTDPLLRERDASFD